MWELLGLRLRNVNFTIVHLQVAMWLELICGSGLSICGL